MWVMLVVYFLSTSVWTRSSFWDHLWTSKTRSRATFSTSLYGTPVKGSNKGPPRVVNFKLSGSAIAYMSAQPNIWLDGPFSLLSPRFQSLSSQNVYKIFKLTPRQFRQNAFTSGRPLTSFRVFTRIPVPSKTLPCF